jgi:hypothetical protein
VVEGFLQVESAVRVSASGPSSAIPSRLLEARGFAVEEAGDLAASEVALLGGVPPDAPALESFVESGGGLLVVGGPAVRALAGLPWFPVSEEVPPEGRPPEPVASTETPPRREPPAPDEREDPPPAPAPPPLPLGVEKEEAAAAVVALVLVLDRSGSMAGQKLQRAREAALACAETLSESDFVGVVAFASEAETVFPFGAGAAREGLGAALSRVGASGGTRFEPALRIAFAEAEAAPASIRHVVLLSDGMTEDWNAIDYPELVRQARTRGVTLSTVGIVAPGDRGDEALAHLARWGGGRFYPVRDPDEIPQVFTVEARRVRVSGEPERRELAPGEPEPPPAERPPTPQEQPETPPPLPPIPAYTVEHAQRHDALGEFDPQGLPAVRDYVKVRLAPGAVVPLRIRETKDPLLVLRSAAKGWVAVWCADGGEDAFAPWTRDERFARLWEGLADFVRPPDAAAPRWSLEAYGEKGLLRTGGEDRGRIPPALLAPVREVDAWTWEVSLLPPRSGSIRPTASGRLRSTLGRGEASGVPHPRIPAPAAPSAAAQTSAILSPAPRLLLSAILLLVLAEGVLRGAQPAPSSRRRGLRRASRDSSARASVGASAGRSSR